MVHADLVKASTRPQWEKNLWNDELHNLSQNLDQLVGVADEAERSLNHKRDEGKIRSFPQSWNPPFVRRVQRRRGVPSNRQLCLKLREDGQISLPFANRRKRKVLAIAEIPELIGCRIRVARSVVRRSLFSLFRHRFCSIDEERIR